MKKLATFFACTLMLAACGSSTDAKTGTNSSPDAAAKVVQVSIKDHKVTPRGKRVGVKVGQPITLKVTSDSEDEIHVHSEPGHEFKVVTGMSKDFTFTIDTPGQVAVESHHTEAIIVQLVVRP
ncbi:MAG: cupredoxin domain-containing protein [Actinomycetota bacterium]|nr:cupredoxin domain-containing protein [Actinomycetota bacterium]